MLLPRTTILLVIAIVKLKTQAVVVAVVVHQAEVTCKRVVEVGKEEKSFSWLK